jgi:hypothetical protein
MALFAIVPLVTVLFVAPAHYPVRRPDCCAAPHSGSGGRSTSRKNGPPPRPTGVAAVAVNGAVQISWIMSAGATSYRIYRATRPGREAPPAIAVQAQIQYTDGTALPGIRYYDVVKACGAGCSGKSAEVNDNVPPAPAPVTASAGIGSVALTWGNVLVATSYEVFRGPSSNGESPSPYHTAVSTRD